MNLEQQIVNQLLHNERYSNFVMPFLESEYFADSGNRIIYETIRAYNDKYHSVPTPTAVKIEIDALPLDDDKFKSAEDALQVNYTDKPVDYDWIVDQTEKHIKDRALELAIRESIEVLGDKERPRGEIEAKVRKALAIEFTTDLGTDIFDDAARQYDNTHGEDARIAFMLEIFNRATNGGIRAKTCNVIMAGCVEWMTPVTIRYEWQGIPRVVTVPINQIAKLIEDGVDVFINSPDGFVPVTEFIDKGRYDEYVTYVQDIGQIRTNADHLFKTNLYGWMTAKELSELTNDEKKINICTEFGLKSAFTVASDFVISIADVVIDHPEHRYYANGVESHNTNVGKSLMLCHLASDYLMQGKNVVYFSLEMSEDDVATRVYANLLDLEIEKQAKMPKEWFLKAVARVKAKTPGKLNVKEYPSGSAHIGHFRHHLQELKLKKKFKAHILILDYLSIAASSIYKKGKVPHHQYLQSIASEFRSLNQEQATGGWTAHQITRAGFGSSDPGLADIAESWGVTHEADLVWIASQGEDLEPLGQFQIRQDKSRYSNKDKMRKFLIGVDKDKQKLHDLDANTQVIETTEQMEEHEDAASDPFNDYVE